MIYAALYFGFGLAVGGAIFHKEIANGHPRGPGYILVFTFLWPVILLVVGGVRLGRMFHL